MQKVLSVFGCFVLIFALCTGCSRTPQAEKKTFYAMNTTMEFTVYGSASLVDDAEALINSLEDELSVTKDTSEIAQINQNGSGTVTGSTADLMGKALAMCSRTNGTLDISVYPIVRAWGFTTGSYKVPSEEELTSLLPLVDYTNVQYDEVTGEVILPAGMEIDLGSIAKGYAGQQAAELLREKGVTSALLNLGGNVQTIGSKPDGGAWQIAVKNPHNKEPMMVVSVRDKAVVTSGGYERYFEQDGKTYWHIMDPKTGRPADSGLLAVTVIGEDGAMCDGLSTSLFVMGLEKAAALWAESSDFEAIFIAADGTVYITDGLKEDFSLLSDYADTTVQVITRQKTYAKSTFKPLHKISSSSISMQCGNVLRRTPSMHASKFIHKTRSTSAGSMLKALSSASNQR